MAIFKGGLQLAPSAELISLTDINSRAIEPGIFYVAESNTILGVTSNNWAVIVTGNYLDHLVSHSQIWIPTLNNGIPRMFIRHNTGNAWTDFYEVYTTANMIVSDTQPAAPSSGQIIWIDTSTD